MAIRRCANTTLDDTKYSSPVPVIGLYIAGGTLVCLLLIICDIFHAYRRRKPWIPCRFFKINSFTLTLLAISTKLPVDLTNVMPSVWDQLSKLCGTQLICICLVFMTPSTGTMNNSELLANLATLAMTIVTIIVNICIQMATGVIFSFKVEHIITMIFMLILLLMLCLRLVSNDETARMMTESHKRLLQLSKSDNMVDDLKNCYLFDSISSSELISFNSTYYPTMGMVCVACLVVAVEAGFRSLFLEQTFNCGDGVSDYKWSIEVVLVTQMLTLVIGTGAVVSRWLALTIHTEWNALSKLGRDNAQIWKALGSISTQWRIYSWPSIFSRYLITKPFRSLQDLVQTLKFIMQKLFQCTDLKVVRAVLLVKKCFAKKEKSQARTLGRVMSTIRGKHYVLPVKSVLMEGWLEKRSRRNIKDWIKKHKKSRSNHLIQLLANNHQSNQQPISGDDEINDCLLLIVLVRVIDASRQYSMSPSLVRALEENFEIVYFINEVKKTTVVNDIYKRKAAEDIWMSRKISNHWFQKQFIHPLLEEIQNKKDIELRSFQGFSCKVLMENEVGFIFEMINDFRREGKSLEELCQHMKQLVIDILHLFLMELPNAIFKYISDSPYEEFEERILLSLKFICRLDLIDSKISWSPLIAQSILGYTQVNEQVEDSDSSSDMAGITSPADTDDFI
ncbi:hypothetical protein Sjap_008630 [Stephania japonica]|uniref:Uncharacterized protein n=1 Tax=Stephania japonica TaxID=461633 RepID=A0AAP0JPW2_9MAGN